MAVKRPSEPSRYLAWGHPTGNNSEASEAAAILAEAVARKEPLLFQNGKFDIAVMEYWWNIYPDPMLCEDTLYQIFLYDPYAESFSLKPSAERILGIKPEEQNALYDWIVDNVPECEGKTVQSKRKKAGAYISKAPVELVGPYACGDVDRTLSLYEYLKDKTPLGPYNREKRLRPILANAERMGIRLDIQTLAADLASYKDSLRRCEDRILIELQNANCDLDSGEDLANALEKIGAITEWVVTPKTGKRSVARKNLNGSIKFPTLADLMAYRGALRHCISNFFQPWLELGASGRLHPEWHSVRQARDETNTQGTRTGRLSSSKPNFQNPPNEYDIVIPDGLLPLPVMRKYILPEDGARWYKRDYSQQELRILAHYSEGRLYSEYKRNPRIDAHETCQNLIRDITGRNLIRKYVKIIGFSIIYGSGVPGLARSLNVDVKEAAGMREAYFAAMPDVGELMSACQSRGRSGKRIRTWGGREYAVEPPKFLDGQRRTFEYKLLNYLIQGSAADCTKEAIIRWDSVRGDSAVFLATVHDEINISGSGPRAMALLKEAMESIEFDVPMLSDGYVGDSWANLEKCE
jgi:DNA polymerase I-like protein with 3'-5' exonuclease and polymerase domains